MTQPCDTSCVRGGEDYADRQTPGDHQPASPAVSAKWQPSERPYFKKEGKMDNV